jgi:hypothetical protein
MTIHYSNVIGLLYNKETKQTVAQINYRLIETDPTKYAKKKWWGEFSTNKGLKEQSDSTIFRIEFEDGRDGDCIVWMSTETRDDSNSMYNHNYHFNGRGKLTRDFSGSKS